MLTLEGERLIVPYRYDIATCPTCSYSVELGDIARGLSEAQITKLQDALKASPWRLKGAARTEEISTERRYRLAILCYETLGPESWGRKESLAELRASLLLKAAWTVRGELVELGAGHQFRAHGLAAQRREYASLAASYAELRRPAVEDLGRIEQVLRELDSLRLTVQKKPLERPAERYERSLALDRLVSIEDLLRRLRESTRARVRAAEAAANSRRVRELQFELLVAAVRLGRGPAWRSTLRELRAEIAEPELRERLATIENAIALEQVLLQEAFDALSALVPESPNEQVWRRLQALDIARRLGHKEQAFELLKPLESELRLRPKELRLIALVAEERGALEEREP
jgi:hypothetical protein